MFLVLAALLLSACADEAPKGDEVRETQSIEPSQCGTVFTPDAELLDETRRVAERWAAATGCDVRVGAGGTRVRLVPQIMDGDVAVPGWTFPVEGGGYEILVSPLRFDPRAAPNDGVLAHEVGHVLHPRPGHVEMPAGYVSCTPLMCDNGGRGLITGADLEYVCEGYPCTTFVSEE